MNVIIILSIISHQFQATCFNQAITNYQPPEESFGGTAEPVLSWHVCGHDALHPRGFSGMAKGPLWWRAPSCLGPPKEQPFKRGYTQEILVFWCYHGLPIYLRHCEMTLSSESSKPLFNCSPKKTTGDDLILFRSRGANLGANPFDNQLLGKFRSTFKVHADALLGTS